MTRSYTLRGRVVLGSATRGGRRDMACMVPVAAPMPAQYLPLSVNYYIREAFAMAAELLLPNH